MKFLHTPSLSWRFVNFRQFIKFLVFFSFSYNFIKIKCGVYYTTESYNIHTMQSCFVINNTQMVFRIWVIIHHQLINHIYPKANPLITLERQKTTEKFFYFLCQSSMCILVDVVIIMTQCVVWCIQTKIDYNPSLRG